MMISSGKINDIFVGEGITESNHSDSSVHGMQQTIDIAKRDFKGLCFTNLVDFDALWGHRRNPVGYGEEIEKFDKKLGELLPLLREDDLLILTADHGNDPTYKGTDHTREQVPFIAYSPSDTESGKLDTSDTFAVIGATIADNFGVRMPEGTIGNFYSGSDKINDIGLEVKNRKAAIIWLIIQKERENSTTQESVRRISADMSSCRGTPSDARR